MTAEATMTRGAGSDLLSGIISRGSPLMPWARIDDAFDDHPKVLALLEHEQGGAAVGLWTLCLTWAYRNTLRKGKTPGLLPASLPRRYLGPGARELAALLVKEELWEALAEGDGWLIHDFSEYLATDKTRAARAEAGRKGAESRWGKGAGRDGNLPSGGSKATAPDGSGMTSGADLPAAAEASPGSAKPDGNLSSGDSNLPSGLPFDDGKPLASDGSRAPARRAISNEIAPVLPVPGPVPVQQSPPGLAAAEGPRLTVTQRSKRITDAYAEAEPMCKWPAVNGVVIKAIQAERYADDEITAALLRMAVENRSVTVDSLRTELGGLPPARGPADRRQAATNEKFDRAMERARARDAREAGQ